MAKAQIILIKDVLPNTLTFYYIMKLLCFKQSWRCCSHRGPFWKLLSGLKLGNLPACLLKLLKVSWGEGCSPLELNILPLKIKITKARHCVSTEGEVHLRRMK